MYPCTKIATAHQLLQDEVRVSLTMEVIEDGGGRLSVILSGHPKLRNELRKQTMEEIGFRTDIFNLDGIAGCQREYIEWLMRASTKDNATAESILTPQALDLLATRLRTPLQIQQYLTMALEAGFQTGEMPLSAELIESVLSLQLDELEPTLTRHGYQVKDLAELFDAKPTEIKALFNNTLDASRAIELRTQLQAAGLPA